MRNWMGRVVATLGIILSAPLYAAHVNTIYSAKIPVASKTSADKSQALQLAFQQVLVKVSGNANIMTENPSLQANYAKLDNLVLQAKYLPASLPDAAYLLQVRFKADAVNHILQEEGLPIWDRSRPLILAWVVIHGLQDEPEIIDSALSPNEKIIKQAADNRGLALMLPMMDVTDLNQVAVEDITAIKTPTLQLASKRYQTDALLIGSIKKVAKTRFNGQWQLVLGDEEWSFKASGASLSEIVMSCMNKVADTLAGRYAAVANDSGDLPLTLKVAGIKQQADLVQLMKHLSSLAPVSDVQLNSISDEGVSFLVNLRGSRQSFKRSVSQVKALAVEDEQSDDENTLLYRWTTS